MLIRINQNTRVVQSHDWKRVGAPAESLARRRAERSFLQSLFPESIERLFCLALGLVINTSHRHSAQSERGVISGREFLYVHAIIWFLVLSLAPSLYPGFSKHVRSATHPLSGSSVSKMYLTAKRRKKKKKAPPMFYDTVRKKKKTCAASYASLASPATRRGSMSKIPVTKPLCFKVVLVSSQPNHRW